MDPKLTKPKEAKQTHVEEPIPSEFYLDDDHQSDTNAAFSDNYFDSIIDQSAEQPSPPKKAKRKTKKTPKRKAKKDSRFMYEVISTPEPVNEGSGLRRSKRKTSAPLAFWRNEKPHYVLSPTSGTRVRKGSFMRESPK